MSRAVNKLKLLLWHHKLECFVFLGLFLLSIRPGVEISIVAILLVGSFLMIMRGVRTNYSVFPTMFYAFFPLFTTFVGSSAGIMVPFYGLLLIGALVCILGSWKELPWSVILAFALYFLYAIVSLEWTRLFSDNILRSEIISSGVTLLLLFQTGYSKYARLWFSGVCLLVALVLAGASIYIGTQLEFTSRAGNIGENATVDENFQSIYIGIGIVSGLWLLLQKKFQMSTKWIFLLIQLMLISGIIICSYSLVLLGSRSLSVAIAISSIVVILSNTSKLNRIIAMSSIGVVGVVLTLLPGFTLFLERFADSDVASLNDRGPIWIQSFNYHQNLPILRQFFGDGITSNSWAPHDYASNFDSNHNVFLQVLIEYGYVGTLLFFTFFVFLVRHIFSSGEKLDIACKLAVGFIFLSGMVSLGLYNSFQFGLTIYWIALKDKTNTNVGMKESEGLLPKSY